MLSNWKKRWSGGFMPKEYGRDACSTRMGKNTGGSLLRKEASSFAQTATVDKSKAKLPAPLRQADPLAVKCSEGRVSKTCVSAKRTGLVLKAKRVLSASSTSGSDLRTCNFQSGSFFAGFGFPLCNSDCPSLRFPA